MFRLTVSFSFIHGAVDLPCPGEHRGQEPPGEAAPLRCQPEELLGGRSVLQGLVSAVEPALSRCFPRWSERKVSSLGADLPGHAPSAGFPSSALLALGWCEDGCH